MMKKPKETKALEPAVEKKPISVVPMMRERLDYIREHAQLEQSNTVQTIAALEELRNDIEATLALLRTSQGRGS